ncbi:hypothetical protein B0T22DRAFT_383724 [Podospora appendiculata]|uniref:Uncharacterized protein n=1 Tax=Podospora appendiculata TaxID=314037 RepID=A0AAE0X3Z0_9PEZI|nr:hypothetical protein B0T22DRAFT_383724 [Podospora appendiculata]
MQLRPHGAQLTNLVNSRFCVEPQRLTVTPSTDLAGKTAIITGSNTGLGLHAAHHLLSLQLSRLILAVRSPEKGEAAAARLRQDFPSARIDVWPLDMSSYPSIQAFARRVADATETPRIDMAILNAGMHLTNLTLNPSTGHDEVIQVNYLSTMLLAILLLPALKASTLRHGTPQQPSRLTIVNSGLALAATLRNRDERPLLKSFDDAAITPYSGQDRYSTSKLLAHLFFARLQDHLPPANHVVVSLVDPGYCKGSSLLRDSRGAEKVIFGALEKVLGRTLDDGAWTYVDAVVVKGKESHGCYLMDWTIKSFASQVYDPAFQDSIDALWEETLDEFTFAGAREILQSLKN